MSVNLDLNHADQGLIKDQGRNYAVEDDVKSRDLNRIQKDLALLSHAVHRFGMSLHYPHIETANNQMTGSAIADKVVLDPGIWLMIGGVPVNTADITEADRTFGIPNSSTRFLRLSLGVDCGQAALNDPAEPNNPNWVVSRDHAFDFNLVEGTEADPEGTGGGPSSPTSMRIFKAVKGAAGEAPVVTWYANNTHAHVGDGGFQTAAQTYFDNGVANLSGAPNEVQSAIEAAVTVLRGYYVDTGAANAYAITTGRTTLQAGESFLLKIGAGNTNTTSACTLQVDSIAAKSIYLRNGATGPPAGYLRADWHYHLVYNGAVFILLTPTPSIIWNDTPVGLVSNGAATSFTAVTDSALPDGVQFVALYVHNLFGSAVETHFRVPGTTTEIHVGFETDTSGRLIKDAVMVPVNTDKQFEYRVHNLTNRTTITRIGYSFA